MNEIFIKELQEAYEARDLARLQSFSQPAYRKINKRNDYRSVLMLSCNNIKHLSKIEMLSAECIMLNLEDGVSKEEKPFALVLCGIFLSKLQKCHKKLVVRVNSLDTTGYDEIAYLNQYMPDAIRVPKIRTAKEIDRVLELLHDDIELHLSIETKEAWHNLTTLKRDKKIKAFYLGVLDLYADIGLSQHFIQRNNPTLLYMLSHFFLTCKVMDVKPISFVYQEYKDLEGFREWLYLERSIGFDAKGCITPAQVELVNEVFDYDSKDIKRAKEIVELFEQKRSEGITGFTHEEYGFIDEPIYKGALALLKNKKEDMR